MKYNDLQDKCKTCEYMKPCSLDMGGNHGCSCVKHQLDYFNKRTEKCEDYKSLCRYNLENECLRHPTHTEDCVACFLASASEMHPYKESGNAESYTSYNEGWNDALNYIASRMDIDF